MHAHFWKYFSLFNNQIYFSQRDYLNLFRVVFKIKVFSVVENFCFSVSLEIRKTNNLGFSIIIEISFLIYFINSKDNINE